MLPLPRHARRAGQPRAATASRHCARPEARWPRLLIVPPAAEREDGAADTPPTFRDYARAEWDLAENRPDLDPLTGDGRRAGVDGRELSSTLASLGISTPAVGPSPGTGPHLRLVDAGHREADDCDTGSRAAAEEPFDLDEYLGYAPPVSCAARDLSVGDLIQIEEGSGVWVVVDEPPADDVLDPGLVAVSWRGDGDESGCISVSDDTLIEVRRPEEDL